MTRTSAAVIIRVEDVGDHGTEPRVWYVGPFLPHGGSAVSHALNALELEAEDVDRLVARYLTVETTYLGERESDIAELAPR